MDLFSLKIQIKYETMRKVTCENNSIDHKILKSIFEYCPHITFNKIA